MITVFCKCGADGVGDEDLVAVEGGSREKGEEGGEEEGDEDSVIGVEESGRKGLEESSEAGLDMFVTVVRGE